MRSLSFVALCTVVAFCTGDKLDNTYLPPNSAQTAGGNGAFLAAPSFGNKQGGGFAGSGPSGFGSQNSFGKTQGGYGGQSGFGGSGSGAGFGQSQGYNKGQSGFGGSGSGSGQGYNQGGQGGQGGHAQSSFGGNQGGFGQSQKLQAGSGFGGAQGGHSGAGFGQGGNSGNGYSGSNEYQQGGNGGYSGSSGSQGAYNQGGHGGDSGAYNQGGHGGASGSYNQGGHGGASGAYSQGGFKSQGQDIPILAYNNENNGDGSYSFNYETANGIKAEESGHLQGDAQVAQGGFSFVAPDGGEYSVSYTADENGFHAQGAHLPTPPPIPEAILKSIEQNAREAANPNRQHSADGDDGSYREEDHNSFGPSGSAAYTSSGSGSFGGGPSSSGSFDSNGYHY